MLFSEEKHFYTGLPDNVYNRIFYYLNGNKMSSTIPYETTKVLNPQITDESTLVIRGDKIEVEIHTFNGKVSQIDILEYRSNQWQESAQLCFIENEVIGTRNENIRFSGVLNGGNEITKSLHLIKPDQSIKSLFYVRDEELNTWHRMGTLTFSGRKGTKGRWLTDIEVSIDDFENKFSIKDIAGFRNGELYVQPKADAIIKKPTELYLGTNGYTFDSRKKQGSAIEKGLLDSCPCSTLMQWWKQLRHQK